MRILAPLTAFILFLHLCGSLPGAAHLGLGASQAECLLRGWWPNWQMQMRIWHAQEYLLWGGVLFAALATVCTSLRGK